MSKSQRQFAIKEIVQSTEISSHEELAKALKKSGWEVNQATLSRDLREMGIVRITTAGGAKYGFVSNSEDTRLHALLTYEVKNITHNESLIVIKTLAGRAQGVAELIDSMNDADIMATIAGDNTIFVAPRTVKNIKPLVERLRSFIAQD
jgi:transcriptional regulator of arginine metabolism